MAGLLRKVVMGKRYPVLGTIEKKGRRRELPISFPSGIVQSTLYKLNGTSLA